MQGEAPLKSRHPLRQPGAMALAIGSWGGEHGCMAQISSLGAGGLPVLGFGKANLPVPPSNDGV